MAEVQIFWDPIGQELDSLGTKRLAGVSDGDTPSITVSIRMLSIDTPETFGNPSGKDEALQELSGWMVAGKAPINDGLAAFLQPKLATGTAGTLQETQGNLAKTHFKQILDLRLTRESGRKRTLYVRTANQPFDRYGRLLAYLAPNYTREERDSMTRYERRTFNLQMVEDGWAAPFIIFPSIPSYPDLQLFHRTAKKAYDDKLGVWADPMSLTGYEYRMMVRLHDITKKLNTGRKLSSSERYAWITRYCADITTRTIFYPQDYYKVLPYNRLFVWPEEVTFAVSSVNLTPGDR